MWLDRFLSSLDKKPAVATRTPDLYQPRAARFQLDVPVSFQCEGCTYGGQCLNVSDSGLLARFHKLPELWTEGELMFEAGDFYFGIPARVARVQGQDVGFAFSISTDSDREGIRILLNSVSDRPLEPEVSE